MTCEVDGNPRMWASNSDAQKGGKRQNGDVLETEFLLLFDQKTTYSAFSNFIYCRPVHYFSTLCSFSQQYCEDVKNDENSSIAASDKNDLSENSVKANQQIGIQKLIGSESCYSGFSGKMVGVPPGGTKSGTTF